MIELSGRELKTLFILGENPIEKAAENEAHVRSQLEKLDLLIVADSFLTETAKLADVVFPSTTFAESQGTQTNNGSQTQLVRRTIPPVGSARQDWTILSVIARSMGQDFGYQSQVKQVFRSIADTIPGYAGLSHNRLASEGAIQVSDTSPLKVDRNEILARLTSQVDSIDKSRPIDNSALTVQAGTRLHQRYVHITRYSEMFAPSRVETVPEDLAPIIFPA